MTSTNSILSKYLPLEKISQLLRDLIDHNDFEQAFELITLTDIDISEDILLIDQIFQIFMNKVEEYLCNSTTGHDIIENDKQFN